jgi:hypothetical protein
VAKKIMLGDAFYQRISDQFFWGNLILDPFVKGLVCLHSLSWIRIHGKNDRLNTKFSQAQQSLVEITLRSSEVLLLGKILSSENHDCIVDFLAQYIESPVVSCLPERSARVFKDPSIVGVLIESALYLSSIKYLRPSSYNLIPMLVHRAYEIDPLKSMLELNSLTSGKPDEFVKAAYSRIISVESDIYFRYLFHSAFDYNWIVAKKFRRLGLLRALGALYLRKIKEWGTGIVYS